MASNESIQHQISDLLTTHPVVLFMKGNRQAPQCGFSAQVVGILDELLPNYETVDVLSVPGMRDAIKQFSDWPTIPQLYINGTFVGGCDIVREMNGSGELQKLLGVEGGGAQRVPTITVSDTAIAALASAFADAGGDALHVQVSTDFEHDLYLGPPLPSEIEVHTNGPVLYLDKASVRRAEGLHIDFVEGPNGGFKLTNPSDPPRVKPLSPPELKTLLERKQIELFDVRPPDERRISSIPAARPLDDVGQKYLLSLDHNAPIALHCHHGTRSQAAAQQLIQSGFRNVYNLSGGIDAWSQTVDPSVPRY